MPYPGGLTNGCERSLARSMDDESFDGGGIGDLPQFRDDESDENEPIVPTSDGGAGPSNIIPGGGVGCSGMVNLAPLIRHLTRLSNFFGIATCNDAHDYEDADPLNTTLNVFRSIVGSGNNWIGNGEQACANMFDVFTDIWGLYKEFEEACGGAEFIPVEYRRRFERMYEILHHVRDMLYRMRRVSLLRAPESVFLEQNHELQKAITESRDKKRGGNHADFQMLATCWDCECNADHGVGHEVEDNTNPFRQRPIGLDDETMCALGKHVRWTWNPPSTTVKDLKPFQRFVIYLLEQARIQGYRRYKKSIYERIVTAHGRFTPAWRRVGEIGQFVRGEVINRSINFSNWYDATCEKGNISAATDYLENCLDPSLPILTKSRRFYAFSNGMYITYIKLNNQVMDYFVNYNDPDGIPVANASEYGAVKYFDKPMRYAQFEDEDWFDIPTPAMTSIMDYQELDEEVQKWHWALLGRLFHDVGELDSWQIAFFLRGVAQSGKSSIILFWKSFFEIEDVGTIANNIEPQFGWGVLADKLVCLGPELRGDFVRNVDQATLQSIISGENVSLAVKNKDPITCMWRSPLFLVGNDELIFKDSSGQIARRIVTVEYMKRVLNVDSSLPGRLEDERDLIMLKANRAYLAAVNAVGTGEVWHYMPSYFKRIQAAGFELNNSYAHFLSHGNNLMLDPNRCLPHRIFTKLYAQHCTTYGLTKLPWRRMNVTTVMQQRNVRISDGPEQRVWNGAQITDVFLHGVDLEDPTMVDMNGMF